MVTLSLAGCLTSDDLTTDDPSDAQDAPAPYLGYIPDPPVADLPLVEESFLLPGDGVEIYARIVRPEGEGPFPVIAQFTPYTAPGRNALLMNMVEPGVRGGAFVDEFVKRGYAFAFADVRGTGDSSGCLDLRGPNDIKDLARMTEWLGTQDWSNGNVGYIGASYPGSTSHMAGIAGGEHLKAVVPVVASTSFYHYHHNDGVPYRGNHSPGGTNALYNVFATAPTVNPQHPNYVTRQVEETQCPTKEMTLDHGGMDQTGAYYEWWADRNLRTLVDEVDVPVLMAQGLADWNVKPDHIMSWFNDLDVNGSKTLIAGQWGHAYPRSAADACDADQTWRQCDTEVPYGKWYDYVTAFFDTYLKEIDTGMFETDVAWVQANDGSWQRSANWPLLPEEREEVVLHLTVDGGLAEAAPAETSTADWYGCAADEGPQDWVLLSKRDVSFEGQEPDHRCTGRDGALVFESDPFMEDTLLSGIPLVDLRLESETDFTHLVAVLEVVATDGSVERQNYGYLNPAFRHGIDQAHPIEAGVPYNVTIDLYPQEDLVEKGEKLRLTLRSHDGGATIESFKDGTNTVLFAPDHINRIVLPVRPDAWQGVRLDSEGPSSS